MMNVHALEIYSQIFENRSCIFALMGEHVYILLAQSSVTHGSIFVFILLILPGVTFACLCSPA
jgi:hypothetical protein